MTPEELWENAKSCREQAAIAQAQESRRIYLEVAEAWEEMAARAEERNARLRAQRDPEQQ
jgi:hypothetical protein